MLMLCPKGLGQVRWRVAWPKRKLGTGVAQLAPEIALRGNETIHRKFYVGLPRAPRGGWTRTQ